MATIKVTIYYLMSKWLVSVFVMIHVLIFHSCNDCTRSNKADIKYLSQNGIPPIFGTDTALYFNRQFTFCFYYNPSKLKPQGESANGDGQVFLSENKDCKVIVSAIRNSLEESIETTFNKTIESGVYHDPNKPITYKVQKENWYVLSGSYKTKIFYSKRILIKDIFYNFYIEYPQNQKEHYSNYLQNLSMYFPSCQ
jgi:hypothetical protein